MGCTSPAIFRGIPVRLRHLDCQMRAFNGRDASQEGKIILLASLEA